MHDNQLNVVPPGRPQMSVNINPQFKLASQHCAAVHVINGVCACASISGDDPSIK